MLGRVDNLSPIPDPPEPHIIEGYNVNKTDGPNSHRGQLRLDLIGPVRSPWNVRAAVCFRRNFNKSGLYHPWPSDLVEEAFLRHIETIRANYYQQIGRVSPDATSERRIRSARRSRVKTVSLLLSYTSAPRAHPTQQLICNRQYICNVVPDVSPFTAYVNRLADEGGMSGDETDPYGSQPIRGQRKFLVVRPGWRSQEVTKWLRVIDSLYATHRFSADGRASRGNWVRHRIDSGKVDSDRLPVGGLPENFYDPVWLRDLSQEERNDLDVQPGVNLNHSVEVLK